MDYRFEIANRAFLKFTGLGAEMIGHFLSEVPAQSSLWVVDKFEKVVSEGGTLFSEQRYAGDGRWYETSYFLCEPGDLVGCTIRDVADQKTHVIHLESIHRMASVLQGTTSLKEILPAVLEQLRLMFNAGYAGIATLAPLREEILVTGERGNFIPEKSSDLSVCKYLVNEIHTRGGLYRTEIAENPKLALDPALRDLKSLVGVPLMQRESSLGAVWVGKAGPLEDEETVLLQQITHPIVNALQQVAVNEQNQRRLRELAALHRIDMAMTADDPQGTLKIVLREIATQLGVDGASLLLLDGQTHVLRAKATWGFRTNAIALLPVHWGVGAAGIAASDMRLVEIPDIANTDCPSGRTDLLVAEGFRSYYAFPLITHGQVGGVLEVMQRSLFSPDADWLEMLDTLATQAAIAIENIGLYHELRETNDELARAYDATIVGWSRAVEMRDQETENHHQRVAEKTIELALAVGVAEVEIKNIRWGALLHDIGKLAIPDAILRKPGPLNAEEWAVMRKHPLYAYEMLIPVSYLHPALAIPYSHHERWDGMGYPQGLSGEKIPISARIFSVIDVWDALINDRCYRKAWPEDRVFAHIRSLSGTHFDPQVVEAFTRIHHAGQGR